MDNASFPPPRRRGLLVHAILIAVFTGLAVWALLNLARSPVGPTLVLYLLGFLASLLPLPFLGYRFLALLRADYVLDRDSLAFYWGLRVEDIPLTDIEWIRPASDLNLPLRLPLFSLPGALLGVTRHPDLGSVEFVASTRHNLLVVAAAKRTYAISPEDAASFLAAFRRAVELGSLIPADAVSQYPSFLLVRAWEDRAARFFWLSGFLLNLGLVVWVTFLVPALDRVALGFDASGIPLAAVPSVRLILLPLLSAVLFAIGLLFGLFFYREDRHRYLAILVWASGAFASLLFILAVLFIVTTPI